MHNVASENLDQHSDDGGIQKLYVLIEGLEYYDTTDIEYLLNYPRENGTTSELLSDEKIIENVMRNHKEDEVEEDSSVMELVSLKDGFKSNNHIA